MNSNCRNYALPSLCMSVLPICRTPEETNHIYFLNKVKAQPSMPPPLAKKSKKSNKKKPRTKTPPTTTTTLPTSTSTTEKSLEDSEFDATNSGQNMEDLQTKSSLNYDSLRRKRHLSNTRQYFLPHNEQDILKIRNSYPPTKGSENLRRICREDCELLENELCQKEYAIAKRHPTIGLILPLEDCWDVPEDEDCLKMGITIDISPEGESL